MTEIIQGFMLFVVFTLSNDPAQVEHPFATQPAPITQAACTAGEVVMPRTMELAFSLGKGGSVMKEQVGEWYTICREYDGLLRLRKGDNLAGYVRTLHHVQGMVNNVNSNRELFDMAPLAAPVYNQLDLEQHDVPDY